MIVLDSFIVRSIGVTDCHSPCHYSHTAPYLRVTAGGKNVSSYRKSECVIAKQQCTYVLGYGLGTPPVFTLGIVVTFNETSVTHTPIGTSGNQCKALFFLL